MRSVWQRCAFMVVLVTGLIHPVLASAGQASADEPAYKPPMRGAPASRVGGGSRGAGDDTPRLAVIAPDHTGLTTKEQPTLYWYVSRPVAARLEVTVINDQAVRPMLETRLDAPASAGIQKIRLADHGVRLQPGIEYRWFVTLVVDQKQRSNDILASGTIQRIEPGAALKARLAESAKERLPHVFAAEGIWYDAIEAVSALIDANPKDERAHRMRAAMLEQVGLEDAARFDRREVR